MKKYIISIILLSAYYLYGQVPEAINYQTIIRNGEGMILSNEEVDIRISIFSGIMDGELDYSEIHSVETNNIGLVNLKIGDGEPLSGSFTDINWDTSTYLQIEVDFENNGDFVITGSSQLVSVPYALFAKDVENKDDADANPMNEIQAISISNDTIFLENGGFVKLPVDQTDDADADPINEIQAISISNDTIFLENGGFVKLPKDDINDADSDPLNEIQIISRVEDTIFLEKGGFVKLPADQFEDADSDPENELQEFIVSETNDTLYISNGNFVIIPGISAANHWQVSSTVTDIDGNEYGTIKIGEQIWMKENLRVTHYSDGTKLINGENAGTVEIGNETRYYFWYNNDSLNYFDYGALYTWHSAMNGFSSSNSNPSGIQGICPIGWHLPSDIEWMELEMYLGMSQSDAESEGYRGTDEGDKLKKEEDCSGTNNCGITGFNAQLGGTRSIDGIYSYIDQSTVLWSSTEIGLAAYSRHFFITIPQSNRSSTFEEFGYSVRCIKD